MAAAGGASSIITQVQQAGGPPINTLGGTNAKWLWDISDMLTGDFVRLQTSEETRTLRLNSGKNPMVGRSIVRSYSNSQILQRDEVYTFAR